MSSRALRCFSIALMPLYSSECAGQAQGTAPAKSASTAEAKAPAPATRHSANSVRSAESSYSKMLSSTSLALLRTSSLA
eukprot:5853696-Pyramimonas_sp.AAC.1